MSFLNSIFGVPDKDVYEEAFKQVVQEARSTITNNAMKATGKLLIEDVCSDKDLLKAAGMVADDNPELSIKLRQLAKVLSGMRDMKV